ncbi:PTS sugar transporter subunit IIA [Sporohalobacter salinus]|uniref:PTS sugar transporter subunit IIA n=1 Tax=Sporohalobacter salinus TaxID=1494606 RepID=UPI001960CA60|nr:hypothetical protein [Sporohalobacter salinus]MBM7624909.1 mannose/fructose-specific phosphotransferase system component IIA [Sporohalobacter salinus]
MRKIFVASHGKFAEGIVNTLSMFTSTKNVEKLCVYTDSIKTIDDFEAIIDNIIETNPKNEIVFFTDIMGGSISNTIAKKLPENKNVHLVSGINIAAILNFLLNSKHEENTKNIISDSINGGKENMKYINQSLK